jgi:hypothetical protein
MAQQFSNVTNLLGLHFDMLGRTDSVTTPKVAAESTGTLTL